MIVYVKNSWRQMLIILLIGICAGLLGNELSPRGLPFKTPPKKTVEQKEYLSLEQANAMWNLGTAFFLDAREPADFERGHIGNAFNLPAQSFADHFNKVSPMLTPESPLVLYCDGTECELSHHLRDKLHQLGYTNTHLLFNGWTAWRTAGLPVTPPKSL